MAAPLPPPHPPSANAIAANIEAPMAVFRVIFSPIPFLALARRPRAARARTTSFIRAEPSERDMNFL
jgi:hypothetical protein